MHLRDNFEKLRCSELNRIKKLLSEQYQSNKFLLEVSSVGQITPGPDAEEDGGEEPQFIMTPNGPVPAPSASTYSTAKRSRSRKIGDGQPQSEDQTDTEEPFEMAMPHHGIALTPQSASAQQTILKQYFDNPQTAQREIPQDATWQNVNQSVSNYVGGQVNQLLRQQRMLG